MPVKDCQTEQHIISTAINVFFTEGRINATMQEIADAAGVNRTLINYYFRKKDSLFKIARDKAMEDFRGKNDIILVSDLPFREKTEAFIDNIIRRINAYPYLELVLTLELLQKRIKGQSLPDLPMGASGNTELVYLNEIKEEMNAGRIPETRPEHFLANIFSLVIHPMIMKPLQVKIFDMSEEEYDTLLEERKGVIMNILFPSPSRL